MIKYSARDITVGGLFGALGIVLPMLFHLVGQGSVFLPMHLPILACGLLVSAPVALAVGVVTPLISSMLTGMPPLVPVGVMMTVELGMLAFWASLLYRRLRLPVLVSIIGAMIAARATGALVLLGAAPLLGLKQGPMAYLAASLALGWPGMLLQIIVVPVFVASLNKITGHNIRHIKETK